MKRLITPQPADSETVYRLTESLCGRYPALCTAPVGYSVLGKPIVGLTLGGGGERVLMAAAFHAQEWLTALICLRLCEELCEARQSGRDLNGWDLPRAMSGRQLVFLPMVNPDGADIALHGSEAAGKYAPLVRSLGGEEQGLWQANARGVDLNHNFDAGWKALQQKEREHGIGSPSPRQWGGPSPESEPETKAVCSLCRREPFRHVIALHTQGEEIYWHYGENTPKAAKFMALCMACASGYTVSSPTGLAVGGGFKDWFIEKTGRAGFTIELGRGKNPLPVTDLDVIYEKAREMLITALML